MRTVNLRDLSKKRGPPTSNRHRTIPLTFNMAHDAQGIEDGDFDENLGTLNEREWMLFQVVGVHRSI